MFGWWRTFKITGKRGERGRESNRGWLKNAPPFGGRPRNWEWKERGCVRRFVRTEALGASREVDSKDLCARLENVGEREDHERERKRVGEWDRRVGVGG